MSKIIFHIDVNSAYLSWESVSRLQNGDTLDLRTIPSAVGGDPQKRHGIILAKSIPAKKYGIVTGESVFSALNKCPDLYIVSPSYELYIKCSNSMMKILGEYSPTLQRYSIDECFLDYTNMENIFGTPFHAARKIKERIKRELGFTVSIGISNNKLLAKMGSEMKKPDGITSLFPEEIPKKMWPLPVEELFMVGKTTAQKLHQLGIYTIGELANFNLDLLKHKLKSHGELIWNYANGMENSEVRKSNRPLIKGIGNATTIAYDINTQREAHMILLSLVEMISMRLRNSGYCAQLASVFIKTTEFKKYSHQGKFDTPTDSTLEIYEKVTRLFDEVWKKESIRHLGVRLSQLHNNDIIQTSLFSPKDFQKHKSLDKAIDKIRIKYNSNAIIRGCFLHSGIYPLMGGVGEDDYPMMSSIL